jgi:protein-S-isoprenylcysteine O-methyltransferase Ste14
MSDHTNAATSAMMPMPAGRAVGMKNWTPALILPIGLRLLACSAQAIFMRASLISYIADTSRITVLILLISETASFLGLMLSRRAKVVDYEPMAFVLVVVAYCYMVFLNTNPGLHLMSEQVSATIQVIGLSWSIYAKVSMGRSFGLLPANRGLVVTGAYRWVRHPIYAGYLANHVGYIAANFCLWNLVVLGLLYVAQFLRVLREEALLAHSSEYLEYARRVRYRFIPGVV